MNTKTCTKCHTTKPLNDYHNDKARKDGKRAQCKECTRAYDLAKYEANQEHHRARARAWHEANRERSRANALAWRKSNIERARAYNRLYNEANKERRRSYDLAKYEANPEHYRATARAWHKANRKKSNALKYARRARKAHAVPQRWKRSPSPDHLCYWCGTTLTPETTHIDHIMPISLGGQDTPNNTANTCANCNLTKNNTHPLVWLARITTPEPVC